MQRKIILKFALIFLVSAIISFFVERTFHIRFSDLKQFVASYGTLSPLVYSVTLFLGLSVPFNPVPDVVVVNLAALLFPPTVAVLATFLGHFLALTLNYWVGRAFVDDVLRRLLGKAEFDYVNNLSKKINLRWIFGLRFLLPLTAIGIDAVSYAAGLAKLDFGKFLLVSLVPWTLYSLVYFFSTNFLKNIDPWLFFLPAVLILGVPVAFLAFRKKETLGDKIKKFVKRN